MHQNPVVDCPSAAPAALTAVLLHGRGLGAARMRPLVARLGVDRVRFVLPQADRDSWYPQSFLAPLDQNEPALSAALAHCDEVVRTLLGEGTDPACIVIGGFSQGACVAAEYLHRYGRRLGAAILWTGGLIGPEGTHWRPRPELSGMPVYLTTGMLDPFVPPPRVRQTVDWLRSSGAQVTAKIFSDRAHEVCDEEVVCARNLLLSLIEAAAPRRTA